MLYVTTRNSRDAYTAQRALCEKRAPDGGFYIPMRTPQFTKEQIDSLKEVPFNTCIADVLNLLFKTKLTGWDIEFCVGRHSVRLEKLSQRIVMGECWRNTGWTFRHMVESLADLLRTDPETAGAYGDWAEIGVRIAVLFAMTGQLRREEILLPGQKIDVSVVAGDFAGAMSLWYARSWGLPIRSIICACNENSGLWELMHQGQLHTDAVARRSSTPEADVVVPEGLERLIFACGDPWEVERFVETCRRGGVYTPGELVLAKMREGMYVSVISEPRMRSTIPSAYATHHYLLSPYTALAYAGLLDYRAGVGSRCWGLILADKSPACDLATAADALGIPPAELKAHIDQM